MVQDDVHGPARIGEHSLGWGCTIWDRDAQSRMGMHDLGQCAWSRLGRHGPG